MATKKPTPIVTVGIDLPGVGAILELQVRFKKGRLQEIHRQYGRSDLAIEKLHEEILESVTMFINTNIDVMVSDEDLIELLATHGK